MGGRKTPADGIDEIVEAWRRERPELDPSSIGIVSRIWYLAKLFGEDRREVLAASGIDPAILDLLSVLQRSGEPYRLSTREIAARSLVTAGAISQRLRRAEGSGLVRREVADDGSRTVFVTLTERGRETVGVYVSVVLRREEELLSGLEPAERATLEELLRKLLGGVVSQVDAGARTQVGT